MQDGSHRILPKIVVLALVVAALGLPINNLYVFGLLAASVLVVFTGSVARSRARWIGAALLALMVAGMHVFLPAPRLEEGHNVFLIDGPGNALEKGLPRGAYRAMAERFDAAYPAAQRCSKATSIAGAPTAFRSRPSRSRPMEFSTDMPIRGA